MARREREKDPAGPPSGAQAVLDSARHVVRLLSIARTLARNDALFLLEDVGVAPPVTVLARWISGRHRPGRPGQRLARALQEAGPSFIKFGQALSTRSDLLGEEMAADLSDLQDRLPPFPGAEARAIIETEIGTPVDDLFQRFDDQAVAAASIAQVHFAIDTEGREVAVKVLRPGIEHAFTRDLKLFLWLAELIEATRAEWRRLRPVESVRTLAETVEMEMDLRFEAAAAAELAENFAGDSRFTVPEVDWSRTGRRVLTTEWVSGIPIDDREAILAAGHDPQAIMTEAAEAFFYQAFRDGFFHGDLHPGNLFVREDGSIAAVDFGIMGRLDRKTRHYLAELLVAFLNRDYRRAAEIHFEAGWVPAHRSVAAFTQACRSVAEPVLDRPQNEISMARLLGQLFQITKTFEMETQPQLLLLQKTMLVAEGTSRKLCPEVNMWLLARPLMERWMTDTFSAEARLREAVGEVALSISRLPEVMRSVERSAAMFAGGRGRPGPENARQLRSGFRPGSQALPLWIIAAVLIAMLLSG